MRARWWWRLVAWLTRDAEAARLAQRARVHAVEQDVHGRGY